MKLQCNSVWIDPETGSRYEAGNVYDVNDAKATLVYYGAPEGTFDPLGVDPPIRPRTEPRVGVSTTASGIEAPDRQMRGGEIRTAPPDDDCPWKRCEYVNKAVDKERALEGHLKRQHGGRRPRA